MRQKIFLGIMIFVLTIFGMETFSEFMKNHTYYVDMFNARDNRKIMIWVFVSAAIPVAYLLYNKLFSLKNFMKYIWIWLLLFTFIHTWVKAEILWWGFIMIIINTLLMFFIWGYFMLWSLAVWTWMSDKIVKFKEDRVQEMFINFWIWLWVVLLFLYVLISFSVLFGIVSWAVFVFLWYMIYVQSRRLWNYKEILNWIFSEFSIKSFKGNWMFRAMIVLIWFSIIYYLYWFELSFIPYSTAWDANHAYMYEPKVFAQNHWVIRWNIWVAASAPLLRHVFITFWFSLFGSIKLWLAPETFAVAMNFLSWVLVLIFWLGLLKEVIEYFNKKIKNLELWEKIKNLSFVSGWTMLLLWLTSGMWAFLVFVDNKTDLWVMAMTTLAILSWIVFIRYISEHKEENKDSIKYIVISGLFFALASMAKPTAFLDISIFWILLIWLWANALSGLWAGISMIWLMWILQPWNAKDFLWPVLWKYILVIGWIIFVIWLFKFFLWWEKNKLKYIKYFAIWAVSLLLTLLVFKWPALLYKQYIDENISIWNWVKWLILSKEEVGSKLLLVSNENLETLSAQNTIDKEALIEADNDLVSNNLSFDQCINTNFSDEELSGGLRKAESSNEDVWRYVWYGRREFSKPSWWIKLWYTIMSLFWGWNNKCYSRYKDAKILCENKTAVEMFNVSVLKSILSMMKPKSNWYNMLSGALNSPKVLNNSGYVNPSDMRDEVLSLKKYYQDNTIRSELWKIFVPYRYIVPLNITFNRSLQNLSSYYTDIWFVRIFIFSFMLIWFVYSLFKREGNLIAIMWSTLIWWIIRRIIWWGILWYWMWLIVWTTISISIFLRNLFLESKSETDKTMFYVAMVILGIWIIIQMFFNWIRIASQGAGWPFARYKANVGKVVEFDELLQQKETVKYNYEWKDVFDLQFGHYNKFIDATKDRKDEDWVLIAWTYLPYFLKNQKNVVNDGMLSRLREKTSDNNSCKSYKRLKNENLKYLVIDPNIATVVMWEWNESLFNRFFAKRDSVTWRIKDHWSISMLAKMYEEWYIKLYYSNNLWAKYAFTLSDDELKTQYPGESDLVYLRAKLSVARFFPDANELITMLATIFTQRISDGQAVWDLADVLGKTIEEKKVIEVAMMLLENPTTSEQIEAIKQKTTTFTQDERYVLAQYLWLYRALAAGDQQYQSFLQNIISQSLWGGSQLIIFELK